MTFRSIYLLVLLFASLVAKSQETAISTKEDRKALFDYIIERTKEREAFSDYKNKNFNFDPIKNMLLVEHEFVNASTNDEFWFALKKLSAARHDRHLSIGAIEGGLSEPSIPRLQAPIRFHPDFSDKENFTYFVSDLGTDLDDMEIKRVPKIGDELLTINGTPITDYIEQTKKYIRFSHLDNFVMRTAYALSEKGPHLPASFFRYDLELTLKPRRGKKYSIKMPYLKTVDWQYGRVLRNYPGYELAWKADSFWVYRPTDKSKKNILLWWYGFRSDMQEATDRLVTYAKENNILDHNLIIDAINSRGGSQGAYALARLSPKPFKTTGGNLKLSDITDDFISGYTEKYLSDKAIMDGNSIETEDDGTWVMDWLHGPVLKGLAAGQAYSNNTPFKCAHLPHYSDWIMQPAEEHFTGKLIAFFGPWGGSHLSQFSAMIYDNNLGYTMGMPDGGYSNTWEWEEDLVFPISKKPVAKFMWNIGHTIRPNGEVLEGNPAPVDKYLAITNDNYLEYKNILLKMAEEHLADESIR